MGNRITIPTTSEIVQRIKDCREEMAALKQLFGAAQAAERAEQLRLKRVGTNGNGGPDRAA
jgi:hypothetical protein